MTKYHTYVVVGNELTDLYDSHSFEYAYIGVNDTHVVKSKMDCKEFKKHFSNHKFALFPAELFLNGTMTIEGHEQEIKSTLHKFRDLDASNEEDIDYILEMVRELGVDFLSFDRLEVLEEYRQSILTQQA